MTGFVSLVGAGPGDPELLTRRAVDRLARADLVLDDALVPDALLELAPRAKRFYVGKRAGRHSPDEPLRVGRGGDPTGLAGGAGVANPRGLEQEAINRLMIRAAKRGSRVVRLKAGDPFVLGRGGEEGVALAAAGIPFEVVPGLSSALAGPALAGIPVTHRGLAAGFVVVSGHAPTAWRPILSGLTPAAATVVVLMGLRQRGALAADLIERGWDAALPAAIVLAAGTPAQSTWLGTLGGLGAASLADAEAPGLLVIGEVVRLAPTLAAIVPSVATQGVAAL